MRSFKFLFLCSMLILGTVHAESDDQTTRGRALCSQLQVNSVCAHDITAQCIETTDLTADTACFDRLKTRELCTTDATNFIDVCSDQIHTNHVCAQDAQLNFLCSNDARTHSLCADSINTTTLCVSGLFVSCAPFSASAAVSLNYTYTLGDVVQFDLTLADPSGAIIQSFDETHYIAPRSGLYLITTQINQKDLTGPSIIAGTPVSIVEIWVSGVLRRQVYLPYLTFNNAQTAEVTTMLGLQAGNDLIIRYKVGIVDPIAGFIEYPGFVTILGSGLDIFRTVLFAHFLGELDCPPCPPCEISCTPCEVDCTPCTFECPPCVPQGICTPPCLICPTTN